MRSSERTRRANVVVCLTCGSEVVPVPVVYGMPSEALWREAQAGRLRLGGCVVEEGQPERVCPVCDSTMPGPAGDDVRPPPSPGRGVH